MLPSIGKNTTEWNLALYQPPGQDPKPRVPRSAPLRISVQKALFCPPTHHFKQKAGLPIYNSICAQIVSQFLWRLGWSIPENRPLLKSLHWLLFASISMIFSFSGVKPSLFTLPVTQMSRVGPSGPQSWMWSCYFVVSFSINKFCLLYFSLPEVVASDIWNQSLCNISKLNTLSCLLLSFIFRIIYHGAASSTSFQKTNMTDNDHYTEKLKQTMLWWIFC